MYFDINTTQPQLVSDGKLLKFFIRGVILSVTSSKSKAIRKN